MNSLRSLRHDPTRHRAPMFVVFLGSLFASGCDTPSTTVVLDNRYASSPSPTGQLVVYHASWQAVSFQNPVAPGASSDPQATVPASENIAYVVLAPGWDPRISAQPASLVVLQSRQGFAVHADNTLHIPVDDTTFAGNCAAGSFLTQAEADVVTQLVFPGDFATRRYDARTCTTTNAAGSGDAGAD